MAAYTAYMHPNIAECVAAYATYLAVRVAVYVVYVHTYTCYRHTHPKVRGEHGSLHCIHYVCM